MNCIAMTSLHDMINRVYICKIISTKIVASSSIKLEPESSGETCVMSDLTGESESCLSLLDTL